MIKKTFWLSVLAISVVLVAGSLAVGPIAFAGDDDEDDDGGVTQTLLCPEGTFMIGIVTGGGDDDDDNGDGVIELICEDPNGVPPSPQPGFLNCTCDGDIQPVAICIEDCEASAPETCTDLCAELNSGPVSVSCQQVNSCEGEG